MLFVRSHIVCIAITFQFRVNLCNFTLLVGAVLPGMAIDKESSMKFLLLLSSVSFCLSLNPSIWFFILVWFWYSPPAYPGVSL